MDKDFNLSLSIGVAIVNDESTYVPLLEKADQALYKAKKLGGGKVVFSNTFESQNKGLI